MPKYQIDASSKLKFTFEVEAASVDEAEEYALKYLEECGSSDSDILGEDNFEIDGVTSIG